jgi:hypothetical protein
MRLVDDECVPSAGCDGRQHFRALDVIRRRHGHRLCRPRVHAERQRRGQLAQPLSVDARSLDAEARLQLVNPLVAESRGREHEHALDPASTEQLAEDQAGLNGLAEPDFVGEQDARPTAGLHGQRGLELVRHDLDAGRLRVSERSRRRIGGHGRTTLSSPSGAFDDAWNGRTVDRSDGVEGMEQPAFDASTRRRRAAQGHEAAIVVGADVDDDPACAAGRDGIPRTWRKLHRALPARCRMLPRALGAVSWNQRLTSDEPAGGFDEGNGGATHGRNVSCRQVCKRVAGLRAESAQLFAWLRRCTWAGPCQRSRLRAPERRRVCQSA